MSVYRRESTSRSIKRTNNIVVTRIPIPGSIDEVVKEKSVGLDDHTDYSSYSTATDALLRKAGYSKPVTLAIAITDSTRWNSKLIVDVLKTRV